MAGGSDGVALPFDEQSGELVVGGQGIEGSDTGGCGVQAVGEGGDPVGVAGLAGLGDLVGESVPVAPELPGAQQIGVRGQRRWWTSSIFWDEVVQRWRHHRGSPSTRMAPPAQKLPLVVT